jgi:hypothetical protein
MRKTLAAALLVGVVGGPGAAALFCRHFLATPALHAVSGTPRRYRIAPLKAEDDWQSFADSLESFRTSLPNATIEMGEQLYTSEKCDMDANCDIVTIDRKDTNYSFKIKNANKTHPVKMGCSTCLPGTPRTACDPVAQADFVQFVFQHDSCHEDALKCQESICH